MVVAASRRCLLEVGCGGDCGARKLPNRRTASWRRFSSGGWGEVRRGAADPLANSFVARVLGGYKFVAQRLRAGLGSAPAIAARGRSARAKSVCQLEAT